MADVTKLSEVRTQANPTVVAFLEAFLDRARNGEILGITGLVHVHREAQERFLVGTMSTRDIVHGANLMIHKALHEAENSPL
jgi:ABC-type sugar transport system ATPase subunit